MRPRPGQRAALDIWVWTLNLMMLTSRMWSGCVVCFPSESRHDKNAPCERTFGFKFDVAFVDFVLVNKRLGCAASVWKQIDLHGSEVRLGLCVLMRRWVHGNVRAGGASTFCGTALMIHDRSVAPKRNT